MGVLTQTCVLKRPELDATPWESWTTNRSHWFGTGDEGYPICGNASGAGNCPGGYVCLKVRKKRRLTNYFFSIFNL